MEELKIHNLLNRAAYLSDEGTVEEFVAIFSDDGVWDSEPAPTTGRAAIQDMLQSLRSSKISGPGSHTKHILSNLFISIDQKGNTASAYSYWTFISTSGEKPSIIATGYYEDSLQKSESDWYVTYRKVGSFGAEM